MKILYLITGLRLGGAENQLLLLSTKIKQAGFDVHIVAMESGGIVSKMMAKENISVTELNISGVKTVWSGYKKFKEVVKGFSPDVIHSHMIHANLFARIFKVFNKGFKLISTAHNIWEGNAIMMSGYYLTRAIPDWSTNVSKEAFEFFVQKKYFSPKKSSYVPNAIDTNLFYPDLHKTGLLRKQLNLSEDAYIFFTAGRLHEQKNQQMLLRAFAIVRQSIPHAVLVIAGEGPLHNALYKLSLSLGIKDKTLFLGRRDDVNDLMNLCDCFVLSSEYEGFGLVVGEAMATMKPVVATDCGGVKEVMGEFGKLVKVGDVSGLANAMLVIYQSPYLENYLGNARKYIESNYSIPYIVDKWTYLYSD